MYPPSTASAISPSRTLFQRRRISRSCENSLNVGVAASSWILASSWSYALATSSGSSTMGTGSPCPRSRQGSVLSATGNGRIGAICGIPEVGVSSLCRAVLNLSSDPISQRLSQQLRLLQKCFIVSAELCDSVLQVTNDQLLRTDCLPIESGLLSQVRCFLTPCCEDVLGLVYNVALARLPLIVVGPALC